MNPAPRELVRVMVGRAEIIPPDQQERIRDAITRAAEAQWDPIAANEAQNEFRHLGRFAEPALGLALRQTTQPTVNEMGWKLLRQSAEAAKATEQEAGKAKAAAAPVAQPSGVQVQEARAW
jgi:hypothetical protein